MTVSPNPPPEANGRLELRGVSLALGATTLIDGLDLAVEGGAAATLMGPSGCGKSSLLAYVCGTLAPDFTAAGSVCVDGTPVDGMPPEARRIGILFQDDLLNLHGRGVPNLVGAVTRQQGPEWVVGTSYGIEVGLAGILAVVLVWVGVWLRTARVPCRSLT